MSKLHEEMSNLTLNKNSKDTTKVKTEVEASISLINESIDFDMNKTLKNSIVNAYSENPYEYMVIMADLGNMSVFKKNIISYKNKISFQFLVMLSHNYGINQNT